MINEIKKIYEDENIVAVVKPAGTLSHSVPAHETKNDADKQTVSDWIAKRYPEIKRVGDARRPGMVHRLDRDTSGVMVIAKTPAAFEELKLLFQTGKILKTYLVLVDGVLLPKRGSIEKPIAIKHGEVKRTVFAGKNAKQAATNYTALKYLECEGKKFSLVRAIPKTGRTHQIRVHFASLHHPVVGDALYGRRENPLGLRRQFLHAESLEFNLENGKRIKIESELSEDLTEALGRLKDYNE